MPTKGAIVRIDLTTLKSRFFGRRVDLPAQVKAYKQCFLNPHSKLYVLPDLIEETGVLRPAPMYGDEFSRGRAQGRRDIGLRILHHLYLEPNELYALIKGEPIIQQEDFEK